MDTSSLVLALTLDCSLFFIFFCMHFVLCSLNLGHKIFKTITQYDCVRFAIINIEIPQHSGSVLYKFRESRVFYISTPRQSASQTAPSFSLGTKSFSLKQVYHFRQKVPYQSKTNKEPDQKIPIVVLASNNNFGNCPGFLCFHFLPSPSFWSIPKHNQEDYITVMKT